MKKAKKQKKELIQLIQKMDIVSIDFNNGEGVAIYDSHGTPQGWGEQGFFSITIHGSRSSIK